MGVIKRPVLTVMNATKGKGSAQGSLCQCGGRDGDQGGLPGGSAIYRMNGS